MSSSVGNLVRVALALLPLVSGCQRVWTVDQIRSHLAADFQPGMSDAEVMAVVERYPTSAEPASGRWPSEAEWRDQISQGDYRPWLWSAHVIAHPRAPWSGPRVIAADMRNENPPLPLVFGMWDPPLPNTIWFQLGEGGALQHWGHTVRERVARFPDDSSAPTSD